MADEDQDRDPAASEMHRQRAAGEAIGVLLGAVATGIAALSSADKVVLYGFAFTSVGILIAFSVSIFRVLYYRGKEAAK